MISINKQIGCIFLIIGTSLGGGILAIPMILSYFGAIIGCLIMFLMWLLMTYSTLAVAEACLHFEKGISYLGLAHKLFKKPGIALVYICAFGILYGMLAAYISAIGSSFESLLNINYIVIEICFVIIFGSFILKGTGSAEWLNRIFLSLKLIIILFTIILLFRSIHLTNLGSYSFSNFKQLIIALPILATTFSAHIIIPSVVNYVGPHPKDIRRIIIIASFIILAIYICWIISIFGNIAIYGSKNSFAEILKSLSSEDSVTQLIYILKANIKSSEIISFIYSFITISITTAFITLSLALKDLILDRFKMANLSKINKNILLSFLLFMLPIILNYYFKKLFLIALSIVGLFSLIMLVSCPLYMVRILRKRNYQIIYKSMQNSKFNNLALLSAAVIIIFQIVDYIL
ncbi:aromatic amino acid transport family protein [Francisella tularensis]|uniref:Aromatic amino acid transporter of the HAAAP family n=4 Tax=Francisella tularensis TaxID=263 RepID=Q5NFU3_FRATT|nr:aromatic amino acid transport family protein [Francisella tularensis]ADA78812.1 aromatic amino acid transporter of the HAAAP family protein [Francisella tularensis subsp. tularensis NE061598]AFB79196.1 Tyrosine-specific transport protein [Francisella tularensis subsp. tularensis TIGB03]AFB80741.1 Tyrosine-specific transport protein [Francisella tularensis subsp. tularensis TI0902]AJI68717.1 tryptophan/tyrosine permease family protein [Francisella tularensis subsp. tularensis SCHU S4]AJI7096